MGPSGSGKSSVARSEYGDGLYTGGEWSDKKAVVDCFGDMPVKEIVSLLTLVGFSSPPSWIKPYSVLSNGEKFRCDLAKALLDGRQQTADGSRVVVFDEYTSVVDRNVAKIASAALAKALRKTHLLPSAVCRLPSQFIAVTCHYDILDWLEPDWVLDMATGRVERRLLRRPNIELEIYKTSRDSWKLFAPHHYLNASEMKNGAPYVALWDGVPVACCFVGCVNKFNFHRISRIVTLPDYQGVGIGGRFLDAVCELYRSQGKRITIVGSHPSILSHCKRSPLWIGRGVERAGTVVRDVHKPTMKIRKRTTASFEYVGDGKN